MLQFGSVPVGTDRPSGHGAGAVRPVHRRLSTGVAESPEQGAMHPVVGDMPFRVPLHPEGESGRVDDADRLDRAVVGDRLDREPRRHGVDGLAMQTIDRRSVAAGEVGKQTAGRDRDVVARPDLLVQRRLPVAPMVVAARHFMQVRVQGATERDVQLLNAAADAILRLLEQEYLEVPPSS